MLKREMKIKREMLDMVFVREFLSITKLKAGKFIWGHRYVNFKKAHVVNKTHSINLMDENGQILHIYNYGFSEKLEIGITVIDEKMSSYNIKTISRDDTGEVLKIMY